MKRLILGLVLVIIVITTPAIALASDISGALHWGQILVSNNSTATSKVATVCSINTTNLINGLFCNANADNMVMRTSSGFDLPFMPGYTPSAYPWCLWVDSIGDNTFITDILYTAESTGGIIRYFTGPTGMTVPDDATIEISDNGSVSYSGYVNTGASGNITTKGVLKVYSDGIGNVTANVSSNYRTPIWANDPGVGWTNKNNAWDDSLLTYALQVAGSNQPLTLSYSANQTFSGARYYVSDQLGGAIDSVQIDLYSGGGWRTVYSQAAPPAGQWVQAEFDSAEANITTDRLRIYATDAGLAVWLYEVQFVEDYSLSTAVTTGEHDIDFTIGQPAYPEYYVPHYPGGAGSYLDLGAIYNNAAEFTLSFWFRLDSDYNVGDGTIYLIGKYVGANDRFSLYFETATGRLETVLRTGATNWFYMVSPQTSWNSNQWYHVMLSNSATTGARYRVDNGAVQTDPSSANMVNGGNIIIGNLSVTGADGVVCEIANVVITSEVWNDTEETQAYYGIIADNVTDYWHCDEGTGVAITSYGTAANAGTLGALPTWETSARPMQAALIIDSDIKATNYSDNITVPDTADNWVFCNPNVTPYMESCSITVDGTLIDAWQWEYSETFTGSVTGNIATPSFRTTSSDADVSANLTSFLPISESEASDSVLAQPDPFIDSDAITGNVTSTFTTTPTTGGFPLAGVVVALSNATSTPAQLPLLVLVGFITLIASWTVSAFIKKHENGSLIVKSITIIAFLGIFLAFKNFGVDFWMIAVFIIFAIGISMASKQIGWT